MSKIEFKFAKTIQTPEGPETFEAGKADSWEEARKIVEKGVYDRQLEIKAKYPQVMANKLDRPLEPGKVTLPPSQGQPLPPAPSNVTPSVPPGSNPLDTTNSQPTK